jgi:hypothetical protein
MHARSCARARARVHERVCILAGSVSLQSETEVANSATSTWPVGIISLENFRLRAASGRNFCSRREVEDVRRCSADEIERGRRNEGTSTERGAQNL